MENIVVIGITDEYSSIYVSFVVNNKIMPLYYNSISNENCIVNSCIVNKNIFINKIKSLVQKAETFVGQPIKKINLCLHNIQMNITDFEILNIQLKDPIFNKNTWKNNIFPNLKIKENTSNDVFVFDFDVYSWNINNKWINTIDRDYKIDSISIKGKKYSINKVIYESYKNVFNLINIEIEKLDTTVDLYLKNNPAKYQLNLLISDQGVSLSSVNENKLFSNIIDQSLGINDLKKIISEKFNMQTKDINDYLNNYNDIYLFDDVDVVNINDKKKLKVNGIKQKEIDKLINSYTLKVLGLVEKKVEYYKKEKEINIESINLISHLSYVIKIFRNITAHTKINFKIITLPEVMMFEQRYLYCILETYKIINIQKQII